MPIGLDENGLNIAQLQDVQSDIVTQLQAKFGKKINTQAGSIFATLAGIFAGELKDVWQLAAELYNAAYPDTAVGVQLDNLVALNGISRLPATYSKVATQLFFGTVGTAVPQGTVLYVNGNTGAQFKTDVAVTLIAGQNEIQTLTASATPASGTFKLTLNNQTTAAIAYSAAAADIQAALEALTNIGTGNVTVTGSWAAGFTITFAGTLVLQPVALLVTSANSLLTAGSVAVTLTVSETQAGVAQASTSLTAALTGPTAASAGTLTQLNTPISGITSTTNTVDAVLGSDVETDAALRARRKTILQQAGAATSAAIRAKLFGITGVSSVIIFENNTDVTDGSGRPPHSFEAVVQGGTDADIAAALWNSKPIAIATYGSVPTSYTDSQGTVHALNYSRPTVVPIYVTAVLTTDADFPSNGHTLALNAIIAYVNGLGQGHSVILSPGIITALGAVPGIVGVTLNIGTAPAPSGTSNIAIASYEIAQTDSLKVSVTP